MYLWRHEEPKVAKKVASKKEELKESTLKNCC